MKGFMRKLTQSQLDTRSRHKLIVDKYKSATCTVESIAKEFNISVRQVQRIAKQYGVVRSQAESNKLMAKFKNYHHTPPHLRVKRKQLANKYRLMLIRNHPYCTLCGNTVEQGIRLEVDHIDEDATNNHISNLQVLCSLCNTGKSHLIRFGEDRTN